MQQAKGQSVTSVTDVHKTIDVFGARMAYWDLDSKGGCANTTIFLHGNPTSSFLWRNVIPHVREISRCIAPDLIGMGKSDKLPNSMYTFEDQYRYLSEFLRKISLPDKVHLVLHDWGSGLGFHWANQNRNKVKSITFMESIVAPFSWEYLNEETVQLFKTLRSPLGEELVLQKNIFVEQGMVSGILRTLTEEEMGVYREPFKEPGESRRPTLTFPREVPFEGEGPEITLKAIKAYNAWLSQSSDLPKLFIDADPGVLSVMGREVVKNWPNLKKETVKGLHFIQEDSPQDIGKAIYAFISSLK